MANIAIQHKRGLQANLPTLSVAEFALTTDTKKLYIGADGGNVQVALTADVTANLTSAKAYTDAEVVKLDGKLSQNITDAIAAIPAAGKATTTKDGLMSKEDKVAHDALVGKQAGWDAKETVAGSQAKATAAETNAKAYARGLVDELVDGAPEALDTISELAAALQSLKESDVEGLTAALAGKAAKVHTHAAADITESATKKFVTDAQVTAWTAKATPADITTSVNAAKTALQGNIDTLAGRVTAIENKSVIDGGTF